MVYCRMTASDYHDYFDKYLLITKGVLLHAFDCNFTENAQDIIFTDNQSLRCVLKDNQSLRRVLVIYKFMILSNNSLISVHCVQISHEVTRVKTASLLIFLVF